MPSDTPIADRWRRFFRLRRDDAAIRTALTNLYNEGRWMLPVDKVPLERQIALWEAAKRALNR